MHKTCMNERYMIADTAAAFDTYGLISDKIHFLLSAVRENGARHLMGGSPR